MQGGLLGADAGACRCLAWAALGRLARFAGTHAAACAYPCRAAPHTLLRRSTEAQADAAQEPLLSSFLYASILSHDSFERSLAFVLSNRLSDATLLSTELFEVFYSILRG